MGVYNGHCCSVEELFYERTVTVNTVERQARAQPWNTSL